MPKATTDRFSRAHQPSAKAQKNKDESSSSSSSTARNPIFNTEQFGQHILKNPSVAQTIVEKVLSRSLSLTLDATNSHKRSGF
ncbi:Dimethyladenosine transferase [Marasmius tenuissimus]|nr:Dimethyladenosine transferase [Marasmius tenuissimus]